MPVESRDDLVTRDEMLEALANQRRALCAAHDEDRAELKRVREYAAKRIAELEAKCSVALQCYEGAVHRYETAERALAEERERHQWRTIDSAPKDGRYIIAARFGKDQDLKWVMHSRWMTAEEAAENEGGDPEDFYAGWTAGDDDYDSCSPTHWKPLDIPDATAIRSGKPDGKE